MRTIEEACEIQGVSKDDSGLRLHFSPIPNWYMKCGCDCPICGNDVWWEFEGKLPFITDEMTPAFVTPITHGCTLIGYGHRWIKVECAGCHTQMIAENFD